uniref:Protein CUSTOS n=1 Tax=Iconisemion striatum TaxID=60296 RepID=A0A1A7YT77_9TELE
MAAHVREVSEDSSSDDEELRKCREAVWDTRTNKTRDGDSNVKDSKRVVAAAHEHDGNELQVTKGFQTHVAKKLEHFLDSCISEIKPKTLNCLKSTNDDDGDGFHLFSTSIPGQKADNPPEPVRRRPVPSSSDSDSEMETRLKEAAVSVKDLLPPSTFSSTASPSSSEPHNSEKTQRKKKVAEEEENHVVRKKKKRKQNDGESEQVDSVDDAHDESSSEHRNLEQEHMKVKRKKKKKQKGNTNEETLI